ncbi:hypothetical protein AYWB_240 [Aster yellows witches'-broom phytoplasma AYWB]|uniref:Uncharacterized protein n=1 Tax=Aster yellows witches'-broom phytoplasma (strain AYWB) TaxID=322098 RepID=Q2NJN6_AYWBP|nr:MULTISPECIES: hypothetical protein [16SrI (Aster yellows group)]ABC65357.1 hypothetical protein AYWB_240 [Aster yellows witches'-broom phytoplasma AYWB]
MARNYRRSYFSKKTFRRNWILPTLGIVIPLVSLKEFLKKCLKLWNSSKIAF